MRKFVFTIILILAAAESQAQDCTTPGQNPSTAFPVCGTSTFTQTTVPLCGGKKLPSPSCSRDGITDVNPFWYKFTCFKSGTLGFLITPKDMNDDYDWELYDITGKKPEDVYSDGSLVVASNWSGESGLTGASNAGTQLFVCAGRGRPLFSKMPELKEGRNYLLLISHFTNTQSGYSLSFGGGTAVITDAGTPALKLAEAHCAGDRIGVKISKRIKCSSIASDGSDFYLMPGQIPVTRARGFGCSSGFDSDSLELTLSQPLAPGTYTLHIKKGTDNHTLLDYCDNAIPDNDRLPIVILPKAPTRMDSIGKLSCAPQQLRLYFQKPILCNSIAADGSDFTLQGSGAVPVTGARADCNEGVTQSVVITLAKPLQQAGTFSLVLQTGSDGNTVIDACSEQTPAGDALSFSVKDTVNAQFTYTIQYGCTEDLVSYAHEGKNGVHQWQWQLDDGKRSNQQNPVARYTIFNEKNVRLIVSNGFCADTSDQKVLLENYLKADFDVLEDNCPREPVPFTSTAEGKITAHQWHFGDGGTSTEADPAHIYHVQRQTAFPIRYTVTDQWGCQNTVQKTIKVYPSCQLEVPNAFTPNNDGLNDWLYPLNAVKAENLKFTVYNRWGQKMFETNNWKKGWNGKTSGKDQPAAVYIWTLQYIHRDTKKLVEQKGTAVLIR